MLLRPAHPADALPVAEVHVRSWQAGYRGLLPETYLQSLQAADRARRYDFARTVDDPIGDSFGANAPPSHRPFTLVAEIDERIAGFATMTLEGVPSAASAPVAQPTAVAGLLRALYVDPAHWNRGVGAALIQASRRWMSDQGCVTASLWMLAGNARAERFYQRDGWQSDGTERTDRLWGADVTQRRFVRALP